MVTLYFLSLSIVVFIIELLILVKFLNVEKFELLPYHNMGKYKWSDLGVEYELENVKPATQDDVDRAKKILGI